MTSRGIFEDMNAKEVIVVELDAGEVRVSICRARYQSMVFLVWIKSIRKDGCNSDYERFPYLFV